MSKMLSSALVFIIATLVGLFIPDYGSGDALIIGVSNLVAVVAMILAFTEGTKELIKYDSETHSKWIPKSITVGWSLIFGTASFYTGFGFYAEFFEAWWEVAVVSVIVSGAARDMYSFEFAWQLVKMLFNKEIPISKK